MKKVERVIRGSGRGCRGGEEQRVLIEDSRKEGRGLVLKVVHVSSLAPWRFLLQLSNLFLQEDLFLIKPSM